MKISARARSSKINWQNFRYMVFDLPNHKGTYAERYAVLGTLMCVILHLTKDHIIQRT